jgi:putative ABC transport system permease protein
MAALLALAVSGPIGVVLAVFALGVGSVIQRRRTALSLLSARGGTGMQLRGLMLIEGLLIAVPAGIAGMLAAALLIPAPLGVEAFVLPVLLTLTPPLLFAIATSPRSFSGSRVDLRVRARSGVRWVLEVAAVGIAVVSLFLLFRRGLAETSDAVGVDPLLVATPLLLSVAVCIGVLRVYPALMIGVQRWTRSRRGAVAVVGAARAVRSPALGFSAALALVVGISIAVFSSVLSTTVDEALATNARMTTGADLRVEAATLDDQTVAELRQLPGVAAAAGFQRLSNVSLEAGGHEKAVVVVLADLASLHDVRPDLPSGSGATGQAFYLSSTLADTVDVGPGDQAVFAGLRGEVAEVLPDTAMPTLPRTWALIDASAAGALETEFDPHAVLVRLTDGSSIEQLSTDVKGAVEAAQSEASRAGVDVIVAQELLDEAGAEPVVSGLQTALLLAALIAVLLSVLAVVLASASAGAVRNRLVAVLRILGMSPRQLSGLMAWELAPVAATAIVAGTVLGLAELWIVLAALDLRPFLGGDVPPVPIVDPALVAAVVAGFVVVVLIAGAVTTAIGRRISPASNVKMGAE